MTKEGITLTGAVVMVAADKDDLPTALLVYAEDLPELSRPWSTRIDSPRPRFSRSVRRY